MARSLTHTYSAFEDMSTTRQLYPCHEHQSLAVSIETMTPGFSAPGLSPQQERNQETQQENASCL